MRHEGTISLGHKSGGFVTSKFYHSIPDRNRTIEDWRRRYAKKFKECYIQISPDIKDIPVDTEEVNNAGSKPSPTNRVFE